MNENKILELFDNSNDDNGRLKVDVIHKVNLSDGYIFIIVVLILIYLFSTLAKWVKK